MLFPTPPMHQKHSTQSHNTHRAARPRKHTRPSHTLIENTQQPHLELKWGITGGGPRSPPSNHNQVCQYICPNPVG